jgi:hypothetical protein
MIHFVSASPIMFNSFQIIVLAGSAHAEHAENDMADSGMRDTCSLFIMRPVFPSSWDS